MNITQLAVFGDSELVVKKVRSIYHTKHPRMRAYIKLIWYLMDNLFLAFNITVVFRKLNQQDDSLDVATSTFNISIIPQKNYQVEMRYRPSILDNVKNWQVYI